MTSLSSSFIKPGDQLRDEWHNFQIDVERVLAGGQAVVAIGPDRLHESTLRVVKTFRPDIFARLPSLRTMFFHESLNWISLWSHPNILTAIAMILVKEQPALVLAYANGGNLADWLKTHQPSLESALVMAQQISAGIAALHTPDSITGDQAPIVHRDIKPDNILLHDKLLMISDLGLIKVLAGKDEHELDFIPYPDKEAASAHTPGVGTYPYMAPELWGDQEPVGPAVDIYAFGLILSELFASRHAYLNLDPSKQYPPFRWKQAHIQAVPRSLQAVASNVPDALEDLYLCCLDKNPARRPTAGDCLQLLQEMSRQQSWVAYTPKFAPHTAANEATIWSNRAGVLNTMQRHDEAISAWQHALDLSPDDAIKWNNIGGAFYNLEKYEQAAQAWQKAVTLNPQLVQAWTNLGSALRALQRDQEALQAYRRSVELDARNVNAWYNLGTLYYFVEMYEEAVTSYEEAVKLDPKHLIVWFNLGNAYLMVKEFDKSVQAFQHVLALNPHYTNAWHGLGTALDSLGRYEEALEAYYKALHFAPSDPLLLRNLADTLITRERYEEALAYLEQALLLQPENPVGRYRHAVALSGLKYYSEALTDLDGCDQEDVYVWLARATAFRGLGRMIDAEQAEDCAQRLRDAVEEEI